MLSGRPLWSLLTQALVGGSVIQNTCLWPVHALASKRQHPRVHNGSRYGAWDVWGWKSHSVTSATLSPRPFQLHQMATSSLWSKCHGALGMAAASTFPSPRLASPPSLQPHLNPPLRVDYSKEYCSSHGGRGGSLGEGVTSSWQQERKAEGREREGARTHFFACWLSLVVLVISLSQRPIWWDTRLGERGSPGRVDH